MLCEKHGIIYHTLCSTCMAENNTVYGGGTTDSYYPPGAYVKVPEGVDVRDMVNSPAHYTQSAIECIEAIAEAVKGLVGMEAMCIGNAIKYLWRWKLKGGKEDLKKAVWYIQRIIDEPDAK